MSVCLYFPNHYLSFVTDVEGMAIGESYKSDAFLASSTTCKSHFEVALFYSLRLPEESAE